MLNVLVLLVSRVGIVGVVNIPLLHVGPSYCVPLQSHRKDPASVEVSAGIHTPPFWQGLDSHGLVSEGEKRENLTYVA